ncbi:phosphotransferase family protein [Sphingomonas sp. ID0503]|uniref:phosphotransferase family protein n=1 Tax=Sphingomonas sp. ID0503 TaxID=3399691 RepID=UPI003AFA33F0
MSTPADPRAAPTDAFIEAIRRRFPVETEIDRILTRKMRLRGGEGYSPVPMQRLIDGLHSLIEANGTSDFALSRVRWLTGGASKIQVAFDLEWNGVEGGDRRVTPMVLRMEPPESVVETSRQREFELIQALDGIVPVPPCFWVDPDGQHLPYPALVYGFAEGVTRPTNLPTTQVTGIGLNYGPEFRPVLAEQVLNHIGRIHREGAAIAEKLPHYDKAEIGSNASTIRFVNWWRRVWEEDREEDDPLMEFAYQWLIANAPPLDHVSVVHGDCRNGNFLFSEETKQITAWLDWELAFLGDRHQDLAWASQSAFRHRSEDGKHDLIAGLFPSTEFAERYEAASGLSVDPKRMRYFRVLAAYMSVSICAGTGYRVARGGKTHQDIVVAWLAMVSYPLMEQMRTTLEEAA